MEKASFLIEQYLFDQVLIDLEQRTSNEVIVNFDPSGLFNKEDSTFKLTYNFFAYASKEKEAKPFVRVRCIGTFKFENVSAVDEIPSFFYRNSIAILFPYLRAFVSMVTNQANIPPLVLPTLNLSSLEKPLRENTTEN